MKKSLFIIIIVLIVILGAVVILKPTESTVVAPETSTSIPTETTTPNTPETSQASTTGGSRVKGPEEVTIKIGESGAVAGMIIKINGLGQDSRCPTDVTCIQAGSVTLKTTVSHGAISTNHDFISTAAPFVFEGYSIAIKNVTPVPKKSTGDIKLADYRITFEATPTAKGDNI